MAPFQGQNISYSDKNNNNNQTTIISSESNEKSTDYYFIIYIPLLLFSLIYIITSLILFILSKKSKLMIIRDINIYVYNTIAVMLLVILLFFEAAFTDDSEENVKFKIPNIIYIIVCAYSIPIWLFANIVRAKKMEFRLKIQNARLHNSMYNFGKDKETNDKLHINVIQFQFYEKWSNFAILGLIGIISALIVTLFIINKNILIDEDNIDDKCHIAILATLFVSMVYAIYQKMKFRTYQETVGVQDEINSIILISIICSFGFIVFKFVSIKFKWVPECLWFVIFFILYHTIIIVRPVFTVRVYQNKVEMLHEKYRRHSVAKIKVPNEVNEMEINIFEKVLNPSNSIYKEFKKFLVGEVCIENLLFYETMIQLLIKCQNKDISDNSWNLKNLIENPEKEYKTNSVSFKSSSIKISQDSNISEIPYYEKLYSTVCITDSPELKTHLHHIFEEFIPEGSEYQLNLTSDLVKSVEQKMSDESQVDIMLFKPVLREVYELLRWTNYPRFLQTRKEN